MSGPGGAGEGAPDVTLVAAWNGASRRLAAAGIPTPTFEARLLLETAAGVSRLEILSEPQRALPMQSVEKLEALLARREAHEPMSYILGYKDFWSMRLAVSPAVLTPRPDTETLVKTVLERTRDDRDIDVLDLGAGSGAILLAILSERPRAHGVGVDKSADALAIARANAQTLSLVDRVSWRLGDWTEGLGGQFDVIVSNPPYVRTGDIDHLAPEVSRYEPRMALDGGADGLDAYRAILPQIRAALAREGMWAVEIGTGQAEAVWALADAAGLRPEGVNLDLAEIPRVVFGGRGRPLEEA